MKINPVIERGRDGLFSAYCPDFIWKDKYSFGGFGDTAEQAKNDFISSIGEMRSMYEEETGKKAKELDDLDIEWRYDVPSLFGCFPYLNISEFANKAGINPSKMRQYACGAAFPNSVTLKKISDAAHSIGSKLCAVSM